MVPIRETDHNDDDDLLHLEDSHKLESDDEDDEVDNNIGTIIMINKCIAQSWLVPVQETDQIKSSEIGATNKSLETGVQSFRLLQYYFQAQFTFHQT